MDLELKEDFIERYRALLGNEYDEFIEYSSKYINKAIRVNTLKIDVNSLVERLSASWDLIPVPWCSEGFWIKHKTKDRFDIGNIPEHQLGYFYVQDPASMLPPLALDPLPGSKALDLCSAPGSKTSQIAAMMKNEGLLVANDSDGKRLSALGINLQRLGVTNAMITKMRGESIKERDLYDYILVDGPCSGTGTIRRNYKILRSYSYGLVSRMAKIQLSLLSNAYELLRPGGYLVYSTCTLEPEENEGVVSNFLERFDAKLLDLNLNLNRAKPVFEFEGTKFHKDVDKCIRINPQSNDTEGFFVAKFQKK